jgi:hypothetical protein
VQSYIWVPVRAERYCLETCLVFRGEDIPVRSIKMPTRVPMKPTQATPGQRMGVHICNLELLCRLQVGLNHGSTRIRHRNNLRLRWVEVPIPNTAFQYIRYKRPGSTNSIPVTLLVTLSASRLSRARELWVPQTDKMRWRDGICKCTIIQLYFREPVSN